MNQSVALLAAPRVKHNAMLMVIIPISTGPGTDRLYKYAHNLPLTVFSIGGGLAALLEHLLRVSYATSRLLINKKVRL